MRRKLLELRRTVNQTLFLWLLLAHGTAHAGLAEQISAILESTRVGTIKTSIKIVSLPRAEILYEKNPDWALNPASNVKLVTATAALDALGPDYTFKTEFFADRPVEEGVVGQIWVKGRGDPLFVTEELASVVGTFRARGLKKIAGDLFVDDSFFDHDHQMTYISDARGKLYRVVLGPLSFNFNRVDQLHDRGPVRLPKSIVNSPFRKEIRDPAIFTGTVIREALLEAGIEVGGSVRRQAVPRQAHPLWTHSSPPLAQILQGLGKFSNNFIAEQIVKTMGAERFGPPGTLLKGVTVMREYLAGFEFPSGSFHLENGSGLSRGNRLSAAQIVEILVAMDRSPWREPFVSSLSVAGVDGTLRQDWKRSPLRGNLFAKTGSLNGVQSLAGYVERKGKRAAFSFLFNDSPHSADRLRRLEERVLTAVWESL